MYAIDTINEAYFIDIGGLTTLDINFEVGIEKNNPLLMAAARGRYIFKIC